MHTLFAPGGVGANRRVSMAVLLGVGIALSVGCSAGGGGGGSGGGVGPAGPVGLPNNPCDPSKINGACALGAGVSARLRCHPGTETFELLEQCAADKTCTWIPDPSDPTGVKKLSVCGMPGAVGGADGGTATNDPDAGGGGAQDAGSTSGGVTDAGSTGLEDTGGGAQDLCGNNICDDGEKAQTCAIDCKDKTKDVYKCVATKCSKEYSGCMVVDGCRKLIQCMAACDDGKCQAACAKGINAATAKAYQALGGCMAQANCEDTGPKTKCGDLKCEGDEDENSCPQDCKKGGPVCGDNACTGTENAQNCPADCAQQIKCGDANCVPPTETLSSCPLDCNAALKPAVKCLGAKCGSKLDACTNDGGCMIGLLKAFQCPIGDQKCLQDAGKLTGAGQLLFNSLLSCALLNDCSLGAPAECGNAKCELGEDKTTCPQDCGDCAQACLNKECGTIKECNNKVCGGCGAGQVCQNNVCANGEPVCGDGSCDGSEDKQNCAQDCATEPKAACGNGKCEAGENQQNCAKDCSKAADCNSSCQGRCGKYDANCKCQCDAACTNYNDCCPDKKALCG